ncbi:hypothetical protein MMC11_002904 [Xylographa trunciseda]|nr:hypothetical protein [Xylographa trunciseda]
MAPTKALSNSSLADGETRGATDSQDSATEMVTRLAQKMVNSTKKRRQARRDELRADFLKQSTRIVKMIDAAFEDPAKQVVLAGLRELSTLLKRQAAIEENIFAHTAILEKAYLDANQEFSVSIQGRMQDMAGLEDIHVSQLSYPGSFLTT